MIKLKLTGKEIKGLSRYFQNAIEIARAEIRGAFDYEVYRVEKNTMVRQVSWKNDGATRALAVSIRHAQIDEFEKAQKKLLLSYSREKEKKAKTIPFTKSCGYFWMIYMVKVEAIYKAEDYVNFVATNHSGTILKNLL